MTNKYRVTRRSGYKDPEVFNATPRSPLGEFIVANNARYIEVTNHLGETTTYRIEKIR